MGGTKTPRGPLITKWYRLVDTTTMSKYVVGSRREKEAECFAPYEKRWNWRLEASEETA